MALGNLRQYGEFKSDQGVLYKVEIYDEDYVGAAEEFPMGANGFKLKYDGEGEDRYHAIKASSVTIEAYSTNGAFDTFLRDIREGEQGRFKVQILRDSSKFWLGVLLLDVGNVKDEFYPQLHELRAVCGLSLMKDVPFNKSVYTTDTQLETLYETVNPIINLLRYYTGIVDFFTTSTTFVRTMVDWYEDSMPTPAQSVDPLRYSAIYPLAFMDVQGETKTPISAYEALEQICKVWGARVFQADGFWWFIQVDTYRNLPAYYRRYPYQTSTALGSGSEDLKKNIGSATSIYNIKDLGGQMDYYPKLKKVQATYGQFSSNGLYGDEQELTDWISVANSQANLITLDNCAAVTGATIKIQHALHTSNGGIATFNPDHEYRIYYMLKIGTYYWDGNDWTTTASMCSVNLGQGLWGPLGTLNSYQTLTIEAGNLPTSGDLEYGAWKFVSEVGSTTQLSDDNNYKIKILANNNTPTGYAGSLDLSVSLVQYVVDGESVQDVIFASENTTEQANEVLDFGKLRLGDGPEAGAGKWGRIRVSNDLATWTQNNDNWQSNQAGTSANITQILCEQFLAGQQEFIQKPLKTIFLKNGEEFNFSHALFDQNNIMTSNGYTFNAGTDELQIESFYTDYITNYIVNSDQSISVSVFTPFALW